MAFISATLQQAFGRAYRYDMLGRFDDPNFGISQNCPTFVDSLNYSYDNVGNRTDLGATYYVGNRLALFSGGWYTYDADGNVHQKYGVNPNPHNQIFYWNPENRLDSLSYDGYYNVTYKYNALGKPVLKYRQGTLDGVWLWDGDTWLAEFTPSNYRDSEYLYNGTDEPYASVEGSTSPSSIHYHAQDELGNVLGTYAGTTVTETISYDPWGVPTYTGDLSSRVMWKGLMWEGGPATGDVVGLYYVRGRWYDPQAGRFVQEDPMGVDGGINVYTFAGDDPINGSDPSGMDPDAQKICEGYGFDYVSFSDGYSACITSGSNGEPTLATVPITAPGDPTTGDSPWGQDYPTGPTQTDNGTTGGNGDGKTAGQSPTPKWRSVKCALSGLAFGGAVVETGAVGLEAGAAALAADGLAAAGNAFADIVLTHMANVGTTYLSASGASINTNGTIARTMLNHIYKYGEGALVSGGLGHGFGISGYLKDLTPGVNVYYTYKDAKEACR